MLSESLIAVADGVGGWNNKGVDPGIFARELCGHVKEGWLRHRETKRTFEINLKTLLIDSVAKT